MLIEKSNVYSEKGKIELVKAAKNNDFQSNTCQKSSSKGWRKIGMCTLKHSAEPGSLIHLRWLLQV